MKDQVVNLLFTGFMVGLTVGFAISIFITMNYYKSGQIDALTGPGLAEAPEVSDCQRLEQRVKRTEAIELWAVRNGVKITIDGRVWR